MSPPPFSLLRFIAMPPHYFRFSPPCRHAARLTLPRRYAPAPLRSVAAAELIFF